MWKALLFLVLGLTVLSRCQSTRFGGREPVSNDDKEMKAAAAWASQQLGAVLVDVISAQKQIVAGIVYYIDMIILERRNRRLLRPKCTVQVWEQKWRGWKKLVKAKCT
ncbi:uncharacterized protein LOC128209097 isoform X2 [Mya arenaria]|uniref:uncharacterized protein LOC128208277 isoform X2 n=1 Tax=Mya arenaria TaxID=6604 RepID=UPI0022E3D3A8|nr:uncharacterized protein LOC128208277 isoform X2 [Mya arenaria]XP_052768911.1 uncharacterized protein LOC128209097 isoform X2 [Mya arenaria]